MFFKLILIFILIGNYSPKQRPNGSSDTTNRLCLFPLRHVSNRRDCSKSVRFGLDKSCREFSRVVILKILNYSLLNEDDLKLQNPSSISHNGANKEYHWSTPRLSPQEKYFVSQLLTSPSKEVRFYYHSYSI